MAIRSSHTVKFFTSTILLSVTLAVKEIVGLVEVVSKNDPSWRSYS
jgi:hypothetical protein